MALRLNRAKVAAAAARRLDFDVTPPASQRLGFDATPPADRRLESAATPPPPQKDCITPPRKCFSGRRLDFEDTDITTPPPRAQRNIPAADRVIPPPRRFGGDSTSIVLPQWWNSKAVAVYFSNPAPRLVLCEDDDGLEDDASPVSAGRLPQKHFLALNPSRCFPNLFPLSFVPPSVSQA